MLSRWLPRAGILIAVLAGAYLAVLVYPQPLFAFALDGPVITLHADRALPAEARDVVACATAKVRRSPLFDEERHHDVYISADAWRWRIVANVHPGAGAVALAPIGRAVFVRRAHIQAREGGCRQRGPRAVRVHAGRNIAERRSGFPPARDGRTLFGVSGTVTTRVAPSSSGRRE